MIPSLQCPHHVNNPLIHVKQLGVGQRPGIRFANAIKDLLLAARFIDWQICGLLKLSNRTCSLRTFVDKSNDLDIQLNVA